MESRSDCTMPPTTSCLTLQEENLNLKEQIRQWSERFESVASELVTLKKHNEELRLKLEKLESEKKKKFTSDAQTQTDSTQILSRNEEVSSNGKGDAVQEVLTAESIAATAESALANSGWVYDQSSGTYFDYNSNLYYYPNTRLYYNYKNGCYYRYNQETGKYEFHYQHESFKKGKDKSENESAAATAEGRAVPSCDQCTTGVLSCVGRVLDMCSDIQQSTVNGSDTEAISTAPCRKRRKLLVSERKGECNRESNRIHRLSWQSEANTAVAVNAAESDSEVERVKRKQRRYMMCTKCSSVVSPTCACTKKSKSHEVKVEKKSKHTSVKHNVSVSKGGESSLSDSEVDCVSFLRQSYIRCLDCDRLTRAVCCGRKTFSYQAVLKKTGEVKEESMVMKKPVTYSALHETGKDESVGDSFEETSVIPCIRAMVTTSAGLEIGTLFIVTRTGAILGSSEHCDIFIPESEIDPNHAKISYSHEQRQYFVTDLGSRTGTTLNTTTVHKPGQPSLIPVPLGHKSILSIGSTMLVLHIHLGHETCDDCEPGQIQALVNHVKPVHVETRTEKEASRRSQLKNLKKKYDLHKEPYQQGRMVMGPQYTDRAAERRKTKGSDNPFEKDEMPTSYDTELASSNKGHQMLTKMGWNKGQGLGKSVKGITTPIVPRGTGTGKTGLGFKSS